MPSNSFPRLDLSASRACFIAEVGPNHNGRLETALDMVSKIADAGADAVKFQTYSSASSVVAREAPLAEYMKARGGWGDQNRLLESVRLSEGDFALIAEACRKHQIAFMSTPFDEASVKMLVGLGMSNLKIPSGEITNPFLLRAAAETGLPLIVSTGMATIDEIRESVRFIRSQWARVGLKEQQYQLVLLHCTSSYPTAFEDVNLRAIDHLSSEFNLPLGFSDHSVGWTATLAAVARGAIVIEKHVTPDRDAPGPDHAASLAIEELPGLIDEIRRVEQVLGSGAKAPVAAEFDVARVARRSLAARVPLEKGRPFLIEGLTALRPATGIAAMRLDHLLGRIASRDYATGELIDAGELQD